MTKYKIKEIEFSTKDAEIELPDNIIILESIYIARFQDKTFKKICAMYDQMGDASQDDMDEIIEQLATKSDVEILKRYYEPYKEMLEELNRRNSPKQQNNHENPNPNNKIAGHSKRRGMSSVQKRNM